MFRRCRRLCYILLAAAVGALAALVFPIWLIAGALAVLLIVLCFSWICY